MNNRILKAPLATLLIAGILLSTVSCAHTTENPSGDTRSLLATETETTGESVVSETETAFPDHNLPDDLDYNGDEIVILSRDREGWTRGEVSVEKLTGDAINDAVYERNISVEKSLHVKINSILDSNLNEYSVLDKVSKSVSSGTHEYDIMVGPCYGTMSYIMNNNFRNLGDLDYLDLDQPWWCQGFNDIIEYHGLRYAVTGLGLLSQYRFAFATIFNERLFNDAQVSLPYDNVRNGTWTLDYQIGILQTFHRDNGDGVVDTDGDIYGLLTAADIGVDPYWSSCMLDVIQKNAEGEYEIVFDVAKFADASDKILRLFHNEDHSTYVFPTETGNNEQERIRSYFSKGYGAMATLRIMELESSEIRNMADIYGVLPMPKYDELQKTYHTFLHDQFTVFCIPTTIDDARIEEISAFLELFNYEGYRLVQPAYYEKALRTQLIQNPDSVEMMDLIVEGIRMELGIIYGIHFQGFHGDFREMIKRKTNTAASTFAGLSKRLGRTLLPQLGKTLEKLQNS